MTLNSRSAKLSSPNTKVQDVPNVPSIGSVAQDSTLDAINVSFSPAATGGRAAVYRAISSPGNIEGISYGSSPVQVTGLSDNIEYTFAVRGETSTGATTGYTASSSPIVPSFSDYQLISTSIVSGSPSGLIEFSNIPQTYKHLQLRYTVRDTASQNTNGCFLELYTDASQALNINSQHNMRGNGSSTSASYNTSLYYRFDWTFIPAGNATAGAFSPGIIDILNYSSSTKFKTVKNFHGHKDTTNDINIFSGLYRELSPVKAIRFYTNATMAIGSRFSLYGIKG